MLIPVLIATQLFAVTIFYGPPMLMTVYIDEEVAIPADPVELERLVTASLCRAIDSDIRASLRGPLPPGVKRDIPTFAFPVIYEVLQWERITEHGYQPIARGGGQLRECPPTGGTPA